MLIQQTDPEKILQRHQLFQRMFRNPQKPNIYSYFYSTYTVAHLCVLYTVLDDQFISAGANTDYNHYFMCIQTLVAIILFVSLETIRIAIKCLARESKLLDSYVAKPQWTGTCREDLSKTCIWLIGFWAANQVSLKRFVSIALMAALEYLCR